MIERATRFDAGLRGRLATFRSCHDGETVIVCGCGPSLGELTLPPRGITIGVNDVGRLFDPTYLVVVNPRSQFKKDRFAYVERSGAQALFTQLDLGTVRPPVVRFRLGKYGGTDIGAADTLHYTQNSPYVGVCLAAFMGARRIGLIGVDLTDDHFFGKTGRHPLAGRLREIDAQYGRLARALEARGVQLVNLSKQSRLTAIPKVDAASLSEGSLQGQVSTNGSPRVFFVHYQFLSCGDVFTVGLENAARELDLTWSSASCDDAGLPQAVDRFRPDLLFVVHGRRFAQRWAGRVRAPRRAVWLLDEPYEVDDTVRTSRLFDDVFVNDPATLARHAHAQYLPVAWDAHRHTIGDRPRRYPVGFIGGGNPTREAMLVRLAREGLLSYVVGGPWTTRDLQAISLGANVPPDRTVDLYQQTHVVVNVFRDRHHFNRERLPGTSLNPRVYEALACGAAVVSEDRAETSSVFPDLPTFRNAGELVAQVRPLLEQPERRQSIVDACRARLGAHTYTERLRTVLAKALPVESGRLLAIKRNPSTTSSPSELQANTISVPAPTHVPVYSVLMVVHNALDFVRISTLRTLRHIEGRDARLVVVDNASTDGAREWLRLLARRGDIDLIENPANIGHGPALELARARTASPYLVTLDSDAFPLADDWLERLRARLDDGAGAAGILHHRNYIHPSCLMVSRRLLDDLGLTFLNEKERPGRLDVAERISVEILKRGGTLGGLERTAARCRGSRSEPVYLGAEYEGLLYHHWYTTRAATARGGAVDDVPREALDSSLASLIADGHGELRDATIVVGLRALPGDRERLRNARAVLTALNFQTLARYRYRIVLVEQAEAAHLAGDLGPLADRYVFAYNPGAYNRGWGFNVGAAIAGPSEGPLCLIDADLLAPPDFVAHGIEAMTGGRRAVLPYRTVRYLPAIDTARAIEKRLASQGSSPNPKNFGGRVFRNSQGGVLWVDALLYRDIGGHDERFRGWGREDREICLRLDRAGASPHRLDGCMLHLDHPRPAETDSAAAANRSLYLRLSRSGASAVSGNPNFGDPHLYRQEQPLPAGRPAVAGLRDWEHWNAWKPERIARIVEREQTIHPRTSGRRALADLAVRLGTHILDLGCGPGAMWPHFARHQGRIRWAGTDVTNAMLMTARRYFPNVPVALADAGRLPWRHGAFDVVMIRHVLEHLPKWLMHQTLIEAMRVAARAVLLDFYVPPIDAGEPRTVRVGEGFLETRWPAADVETPVRAAGWSVRERRPLDLSGDEVWVLAPPALEPLFIADLDRGTNNEPFKFSIIMPTFHRRHRLAETVATVLAQTYSHWELIIIDNAGDCGLRFADPRVSLHLHADKASAAFARNQGLRYASGDLVCFFDDDDDMFPSYLEQFARAFTAHPAAQMVCCGMILRAGRVNYSFATPEVCLRRVHATATWREDGPGQDQRYFRRIVADHGWKKGSREIVTLQMPLCRANRDPRGGLRAGRY
jgi:glycosyltransferase involved in cell wall biosynthesis